MERFLDLNPRLTDRAFTTKLGNLIYSQCRRTHHFPDITGVNEETPDFVGN